MSHEKEGAEELEHLTGTEETDRMREERERAVQEESHEEEWQERRYKRSPMMRSGRRGGTRGVA